MVVVVEWGAIYFAETGDLTGVSLWLWIERGEERDITIALHSCG